MSIVIFAEYTGISVGILEERKDICRKVFCCDDPVVTLAVYPAGMESGRG